MKTSLFARLGIASVAVALVSCGGGGGSSNLAGIDRLGVTGPISGFGSVIVNGVEWRTNAATVSIDGQTGSESELQIGQIVTIKGKPDSDGKGGQADSITLQDNVQGVVLSVDPTNSRLAILGQLILVTADTSTDPTLPGVGIDGISVGDSLAVSGFVDSAGNIHATRVQAVPASTTQSVIGKVNSVNVSAKTLTIGGLTVLYSGATPTGFTGSDPAAGDIVFASGTVNANNQLIATALTFEKQTAPGAAGEDGQVEGLVSAFTSSSNFEVNGVTVLTNASTQFENGTAADVKLNAKVEAEGQVDSSGRIVASKVSIKASSSQQQVEIVQNVEAVDTAAGTLTVFGIKVQVNSETRLEDKSLAEKRPFGLANIVVGDQLRIRGTVQANAAAKVLATRVDREDIDQGDITLRGPVDTVNGNSGVTVLGASIVTDNTTQFFNGNTPVGTATDFYPLVQQGTTVVRALSTASSVSGNVITANELRIIPAGTDD
jgi:hypothetical protein